MKINKLTVCIGIIFLTLFFTWSTPVFADDVATSTSIHLDITSATSTLFDNTVVVTPCAPSASSTVAISGYCAVSQSGLPNTWSNFSGSQFLESIDGVANNSESSLYWGWFSNMEYGQTSLDQHLLIPNEDLLITIGRMPLKIIVSTTTPILGATTTVSALEFGFDSSWNGVWLPAASSTIHDVNGTHETDTLGNYDASISSTTPFEVWATKDGFIDSDTVLISPTSPTIDPAPIDPVPPATSGDSSISEIPDQSHCSLDVKKAIQFLIAQQKSDGSFGPGLYTDWVAIALAADAQSSSYGNLVSYMKTEDSSLSHATDYERHAMALEALGINPYDGTSVNYIQKITDTFDGVQIGDSALVNDDIFAIFPLMKAGYTSNDDIIQKTIAFILSKRHPDGSWEGSADLTAAAIQAITLTPSINGVSQAIEDARNYLVAQQHVDGGFGSSFTTSWVLQAIAALGESNTAWVNSGQNPQDALCLSQQNDGGLELSTANDNTRVWATSYGIPAALNKSWPMILSSFSRQIPPPSNVSDEPAIEVLAMTPIMITPTATTSLATTSVATTSLATTSVATTSLATIQPVKIISTSTDTITATTTATTTVEYSKNSSGLAAVAASGYHIPLRFIGITLVGLLGLLGIAYVFKSIKNK